MNFETTFTPMYIGKMLVKNRLVVPAMDSGMPEPDGSINENTISYYGARARGGVVEQRRPKPPGRKGRAQLQSESTHVSKKNLPGLVSCGFLRRDGRKVPEIFQWHWQTVADCSGTRRHTPGADAPSLLYGESAKAEALAYLETKARIAWSWEEAQGNRQ